MKSDRGIKKGVGKNLMVCVGISRKIWKTQGLMMNNAAVLGLIEVFNHFPTGNLSVESILRKRISNEPHISKNKTKVQINE